MKTNIISPEIRDTYSLSFAQKYMWELSHFEHLASSFKQLFAYSIKGEINPKFLEQAIREVASRHEVLRTVFESKKGGLNPTILDLDKLDFELAYVRLVKENKPESTLQEIINEERSFHFDLAKGPLFRVKLLALEDKEYVAIFNFHQLIFDNSSQNLFLEELWGNYSEIAGYTSPAKPVLTRQFQDFTTWEQSPEQENLRSQQEAYWTRQFSNGIKKPILPVFAGALETKENKNARVKINSEQTRVLREMASNLDLDLFDILMTLYVVFLSKICNSESIPIATPNTRRDNRQFFKNIGQFENIILLTCEAHQSYTFSEFMLQNKALITEAFQHGDYPYHQVVKKLKLDQEVPEAFPFDLMFSMKYAADADVEVAGLTISPFPVEHQASPGHVHMLVQESEDYVELELIGADSLFDDKGLEKSTYYLTKVLETLLYNPERTLGEIEILEDAEKAERTKEESLSLPSREFHNLLELLAKKGEENPGSNALIEEKESYSYEQIDLHSGKISSFLRERHQISPGDRIGILGAQSAQYLIGVFAVLKAGGICVPIEPSLTQKEKEYIIEDSQLHILLCTDERQEDIGLDCDLVFLDQVEDTASTDWQFIPDSTDLCCLLYSSESLFLGKAAKISYANVSAYLAGMKHSFYLASTDNFLLTSSASPERFLFSAFWMLTEGIEIVIHPHAESLEALDQYVLTENLEMDFSLFFFASYNIEEDNKYKLLVDTVKYGDQAGFTGVWTPERHFHEFGGLFPNPSVSSAALAMITENMALRSGSVVSPLHDSIRIAEEWSVVDNLSKGRIQLSFAPGWNFDDFILSKEEYEDRHAVMHRQMEIVKKLWRGESIKRVNGIGKEVEIKTFPAPIQKELPIWVTAAGNEKTFIKAGEMGADILTHLLGQDIEDLTRKIKLYRDSYKKHGWGDSGKIAVMLHTFVGDELEEVEKIVEEPFFNYIKSATSLSKILYKEAGLSADDIPEEDKDIMLRHSLNRYYQNAALIGTPQSCLDMIRRLKAIGIDEIACLVDFGIEAEGVMKGLGKLKKLKTLCKDHRGRNKSSRILQMDTHRLPELLASKDSDAFLQKLKTVFLFGQRADPALIKRLKKRTEAQIYQLYSKPETNSASFICETDLEQDIQVISSSIGDARMYVLGVGGKLLPNAVVGELYVGGKAVSEGFWSKEKESTNLFVQHPFQKKKKIFRTGEKGYYLPNGQIALLDTTKANPKQRKKRYLGPQTELHVQLIHIFSKVLHKDLANISIRDTFLQVGIPLSERIQIRDQIKERLDIDLRLEDLYTHTTIEALVDLLESRAVPNYSLIPTSANNTSYQLSKAQQSGLEQQLSSNNRLPSVISGVYKIRGSHDEEQLIKTLKALGQRQQAFSIKYTVSEDRYSLSVDKTHEFEVEIVSNPDVKNWQEALHKISESFDLLKSPLARMAIFKASETEWYLILMAHEIVADPYSLNILKEELQQMLQGIELSTPKHTYLGYLNGLLDSPPKNEYYQEYWKKTLASGYQFVDLPVMQERDLSSSIPFDLGRTRVLLEPSVQKQITEVSERMKVPESNILLSCYCLLLSKMTESPDLLIDRKYPGRPQKSLKNLVGALSKTLPIQVQVSESESVNDFLYKLKKTWQETLNHQDLGLKEILELLGRKGEKTCSNVYFSTLEDYPNDPNDTLETVALAAQENAGFYEFGMEIIKTEKQSFLDIVFAKDLYDDDIIELFKTYFFNILSHVLENQASALNDIELE